MFLYGITPETLLSTLLKTQLIDIEFKIIRLEIVADLFQFIIIIIIIGMVY